MNSGWITASRRCRGLFLAIKPNFEPKRVKRSSVVAS